MPVPMIYFPSGEAAPRLGQDTWTMGLDARQRRSAVSEVTWTAPLVLRCIWFIWLRP